MWRDGTDCWGSTNMLPKQTEMDGIVQQIYAAIQSENHLKSTLLVLLGDHGMNDAGNHGGSAPGETSPALVFLSPKLKILKRAFQVPLETREDFSYYSVVEQSDLAPTLGALLGFPVPKNNLGAFILDFLPFWPRCMLTILCAWNSYLQNLDQDQVQILMRNAEQVLTILTATFGEELFDTTASDEFCLRKETDAEDLACRWRQLVESTKIKTSEEDLEWASAMSQVSSSWRLEMCFC